MVTNVRAFGKRIEGSGEQGVPSDKTEVFEQKQAENAKGNTGRRKKIDTDTICSPP